MIRRALLIAALAVVVASCGVPAEDSARATDADEVPFALLDEEAPPLVPPTTAAVSEPVSACFIHEDRLAVVARPLARPVTLRAALDALATPPDAPALMRTALADTSIVRDIQVTGGIARIDLQEGISSLGGDDQLLAVAQIVCTLTSRPGVGQVSFTLEGAPIEVPRGDGSLVSAPVSRDDYASLIA